MKKTLFLLLLAPSVVWAIIGPSPVPKQSLQYLPVIKKEAEQLMPDFAYPYYIAGLIEHESCITLTHSKCWNPNAELRTKREQGVGLGQITRAYKSNGSLRFDTLDDLRRNHRELRELSWSNIKNRADLQIRSIIIMLRNNYKALYAVPDPFERLAMSDASYNGGLNGLQKERTVCGLAKNCDPKIWFENVERVCLKSRRPMYGTRSACDINRAHVRLVLLKTMPKYKSFFKK